MIGVRYSDVVFAVRLSRLVSDVESELIALTRGVGMRILSHYEMSTCRSTFIFVRETGSMQRNNKRKKPALCGRRTYSFRCATSRPRKHPHFAVRKAINLINQVLSRRSSGQFSHSQYPP
jgi:hypothetical protein